TPRGSRSATCSAAADRRSTIRRLVELAAAPQPLELGARHVAVQHERREARAAEPARASGGRDQTVRDESVVVDPELALHPAVLVDLGVERAKLERRELAGGPLEIN